MSDIKYLEKLKEHISEYKKNTLEDLVEGLQDFNEFDRGVYYGRVHAYTFILEDIRQIIRDSERLPLPPHHEILCCKCGLTYPSNTLHSCPL